MAAGFKTGGRQKGTPNKITAAVKEKIQSVVEESLESLDLHLCTNTERIKLIEIGLKYLLPTMKHIEGNHEANLNSIDFKSILRFEE